MKLTLNQTNKIVVITGGSKGIGKEVLSKFLSTGNKIYFTYRKKNNFVKKILKDNVYKNKLIPINCDMMNIRDLIKLKKKLSKERKIDVLVNNVGDVIKRSNFLNSTDKLWIDNLKINLISAVSLTRLLMPQMSNSKNSVIINISSIASRTGGGGDSLHYGVSKSALNMFTKGLAKELKKNIRVVGIAPSAVNTVFQKKYSSKARLKKIIKETPLNRIGLTTEISELAYFLAGKGASFISGETIFVTGGR